MVCPFDVLSFHALANGHLAHAVALKCDGCVERIRAGLEPACTEACKVGALVFGDLNELAEEARIREASAVLAAAAALRPQARAVPDHVAAWRALGRSANETLEE